LVLIDAGSTTPAFGQPYQLNAGFTVQIFQGMKGGKTDYI